MGRPVMEIEHSFARWNVRENDMMDAKDEYRELRHEGYLAGYRAAESDLAPAVRLAEAQDVLMVFNGGSYTKDFEKLMQERNEALSAYRATKAQPARDPLKELAIVLGCMPGSHNVTRAMELCAEAIRRAK